MKIKVRFSKLEIDSLVNSESKGGASSFASKLKAAAAKSAVKYAPSVAEAVIEKKLSDFIKEHDLGIELDAVVLLKKQSDGEIAGIAASVSKINYARLFASLEPVIEKALSKEDEAGLFRSIVSIIGDDRDAVIESVAHTVSDEKKALIISAIAEKYNKEICKMINDAAEKEGLAFAADKIAVRA